MKRDNIIDKLMSNKRENLVSQEDFEKNGNKELLELAIIDAYSEIADGFIIWGNSDSLTWYHCVDKEGNSRNAQIIDSNGIPKDIYYQYRDAFYINRK